MMKRLEQCTACSGFLKLSATACPHCGIARKRSALGVAIGTLGGASVAFTLMACYGAAPQACPDGTRDCLKPAPTDNSGTTAPALGTDGGK